MSHDVAPDRSIAGWWAGITFVLVLMAGWLVNDSEGGWFFVGLLAVCALVWAWFLTQAVLPGLVTIRIDESGIRGRFLWRRIDVPLGDVHLVRVDRLAGERVLEIIATFDGVQRTRIVPLPVGTSTQRLHAALAATLGTGGPALAQPPTPQPWS